MTTLKTQGMSENYRAYMWAVASIVYIFGAIIRRYDSRTLRALVASIAGVLQGPLSILVSFLILVMRISKGVTTIDILP